MVDIYVKEKKSRKNANRIKRKADSRQIKDGLSQVLSTKFPTKLLVSCFLDKIFWLPGHPQVINILHFFFKETPLLSANTRKGINRVNTVFFFLLIKALNWFFFWLLQCNWHRASYPIGFRYTSSSFSTFTDLWEKVTDYYTKGLLPLWQTSEAWSWPRWINWGWLVAKISRKTKKKITCLVLSGAIYSAVPGNKPAIEETFPHQQRIRRDFSALG